MMTEEQKEEAVEEKVADEKKVPTKKDEKPKEEIDLKAEIQRVIDGLWAEEQKELESKKSPSQEDFKKAVSEVADKIQSTVASEYEARFDAKLKEFNEKLESMTAQRQAPKTKSKNPFSAGEASEADKYAAKKAYLERMGLPVRE